MKQIVNMKPMAYLTLAIWAGVLSAISYGMLAVSYDARMEFGSLFHGESSAMKSLKSASQQTASAREVAALPQEDKDRLSASLESLKTTLSAYNVRLQTAEAAEGSIAQ